MSNELAVIVEGEIEVAPNQPASQNVAVIYLASLSEGSRRTMLGALDKMAGIATNGKADAYSYPWQSMTQASTKAIRARLLDDANISRAYANKLLSALRGVIKTAWELELIDSETYHRAAAIKAIKKEESSDATKTGASGRAIAKGEIEVLSSDCNDGTPKGARDKALFAVLYGCGARRAEVAGLDVADYEPTLPEDTTTGKITFRHTKNKEPRTLYVTNGSKTALDAWLSIRGNKPGALFHPVTKAGAIQQRGMTEQAIWKVVRTRTKAAGIPEIAPHDFRRTFAGNMFDAGVDIVAVQKMMGHASPTTTAQYDRRGERVKMAAATTVKFPI